MNGVDAKIYLNCGSRALESRGRSRRSFLSTPQRYTQYCQCRDSLLHSQHRLSNQSRTGIFCDHMLGSALAYSRGNGCKGERWRGRILEQPLFRMSLIPFQSHPAIPPTASASLVCSIHLEVRSCEHTVQVSSDESRLKAMERWRGGHCHLLLRRAFSVAKTREQTDRREKGKLTASSRSASPAESLRSRPEK